MLKIGITGNIASGKSSFEKYLKENGFKVLCLDFITAFLYENSSILQGFLLKKFNTIDKNVVAKIVFSDMRAKKELENYIYPLILNEMNNFFDENKIENIVFVSAALLFESGFDKYFDKIVFIRADKNIRLERLMKRNNILINEAELRIKAQADEKDKILKCDFIIDNSGTIENLKAKTNDFIKSLNIPL